MIRQAEAAKAKVFQVSGKKNFDSTLMHSVVVDEEYAILGANIEESLHRKIVSNEYVDFARLIPRDRIATADSEKRLEIVYKDGKTFFQPISERDTTVINGIYRWDQAF